MLVYGDRSERADPNERLEVLADCAAVRAMAPGLDRHSRLVALLIEAGRLLQGLADEDFTQAKYDRRTPSTDALSDFLVRIGHAVCRSWNGDAFDLPDPPQLAHLPPHVGLRHPEGFAFYAVYPEAYANAARKLRLIGPPRVIGLRSIGTSLGAIVAAAVGARSFVTVRPFGNPSARKIAIDPALERELLAGEAHYIIVDEGPGQSGSSFGSVADWLQEHGVSLDRIAFVPSHSGALGPKASPAHRARWSNAQKAIADLGPQLPRLLERWAAGLLGPLDGPLLDLSGGAWRSHVYPHERDWPAVNPMWERRKYLARAGGEAWLLKFAGLGWQAERKLALARELHRAGLAPEPCGLLHGFLVERWHDGATRLTVNDRPLREIAHYLGARARAFSAREEEGASVRELYAMVCRNVSLAMGDQAARSVERWAPRLDSLERRVVRVRTDNKLEPHEWLRLSDGRLLKSDSIDHHAAHDLVAAQDLAWDIAGAAVEFDLNRGGMAWLAAEAGREAGRLVDSELLEFMTLAYLAFRIGQARLSMEMCAGVGAEAGRLARCAQAYERRVRKLLESSTPATPRNSSLDPQAERTAAGTIPTALG